MLKEGDAIKDIYECCVDIDIENERKVSFLDKTAEERDALVKDKEVLDRKRGDCCACALSVFCAVARTGLVLADTKLSLDERAAEGEPEGPGVKLLQHTLKRHPKHEDVAQLGLLLLYSLVRTEMDLPMDGDKKYGAIRAMRKPTDECMPACSEQVLRQRDRFSDLASTSTEFGRQTEPEWPDEVQKIGRAVQYALKPSHQKERRDTYWKPQNTYNKGHVLEGAEFLVRSTPIWVGSSGNQKCSVGCAHPAYLRVFLCF
jgi:hypothetical protein